MKNFLKYGVVTAAVGVFLLCTTVMLLPVLINVQKFLPQIEKQVTQITGRPFSVGSDFGLSFFPWLSVTFSDMRLGNPEGVFAEDFVRIDSFEARVKLLPLLFNKVEVSRFVVSGLNIHLQREQSGKNNWELLARKEKTTSSSSFLSKVSWLFSREYFVDLFAITGGALSWNERQHDKELHIDDVMVLLNDVSSAGNGKADFKAIVEGHQIRGAGSIGPVSSNLSSLFMDLHLQINDRIQAIVKGDCSYPLTKTECDLIVNVPTFSVDNLYGFSKNTSVEIENDGKAGPLLWLTGHFIGNEQKFTIDSGSGNIDDSPFTFQLSHDPKNPIVNELDINFSSIDLNRYFEQEKVVKENHAEESCPLLESIKSAPYTVNFNADEMGFAHISFFNVDMDMRVETGLMHVSNGGFDLHGGKGQFEATIGLQDRPVLLESRVDLQQIEMESFSGELLGVPFLSGLMDGHVELKSSGLPGSELGTAFIGDGSIQIGKGTISGIDLFSATAPVEEEKTEFTQLSTSISMEDGIVRMQPLTLVGKEGVTEMVAVVEVKDKIFSITSNSKNPQNNELSLSGRYGPDGLTVEDFTDIHETKMHELRDAQTLVDEKMPVPVEEGVSSLVGKPLIDPAIVAQRFGLKPEMIAPAKVKKAYNVGKGRVRINPLQLLESADF